MRSGLGNPPVELSWTARLSSVSPQAASGCNCLPLTNGEGKIKCGVAAVLPSKRPSALSSFRALLLSMRASD